MPKHPDVTVRLVGEDGNAFSILGRVYSALRRAGYRESAQKYIDDAKSGDYDNLLRVTMDYVNVE